MNNYSPKLDLLETEKAIKFIKDNFELDFAMKLDLVRVSAPLFVLTKSGLNDGLSGKEKAISFKAKDIDDDIEIVHSLAKWKREALKRYNFPNHHGLYTDMNAIRKDESLDAIHSIYVDQWDYEVIIKKEERNLSLLFKVVNLIYEVLKEMEDKVNALYPVFRKKLPEDIYMISSTELLNRYPDKTSKEREYLIAKEKKAVFLYQIGWPLSNGESHDQRAPDYDDWLLNGDIIVYNEVLDIPFELSSMGIRVDKDSLKKQVEYSKDLSKLDNDYAKMVMNEELPYTLGGGIGQSRLCMFYLEKAHIGEVQASLWSKEEINKAQEKGIKLL